MKKNKSNFKNLVNTIFDRTAMIFGCILNTMVSPFTGGYVNGFIILNVAGASGDLPEGILSHTKLWHGSIAKKFYCINNLVDLFLKNGWSKSVHFTDLVAYRDQLKDLIPFCKTTSASTKDRLKRDTMLKAAVDLCLTEVKMWSYGLYANDQMKKDDIHLLGFLLPGEHGGRHDRTEPTKAIAEVKVHITNENFIHVVIDQSTDENAGPVKHGWPKGVKNAVIVIIAADGETEVLRQLTTNLHNEIEMPEGSHGKQFIIKAAFLKHIDDEPKFGNEPTFSMPLTTQDLAANLRKQHQEEIDAHLQEIEKQRLEIERLQNELKNKG